MSQNNIRLSRTFIYLLRRVLGWFLTRKYNIRSKHAEIFQELQPPYLVLSNHFNTFDPFIISITVPRHIHWVASDLLFRNRYLRFLLRRLVGSISKSKSKSDFQTIRQIADVVRQEGVVGLFPEGQRSWDGKTLPLMYATAKLVRLLKVPVVFCVLEGGYHSLPRWSKKRRRGQLTVAFQKPWMPEEFADRSADEIFEEMTKRLDYDDYAHQRDHRVVYRSRRRAEYLEHVLFICPRCLAFTSLVSRGNTYYCSHCGLSSVLDPYGFFKFDDPGITIQTVADWNRWQREYLKGEFASGRWKPEEVIISDDRVMHFTGYRDKRMKKQGRVWVGMTLTGFWVKYRGESAFYPFEQLESLSVALQRNFEFYLNETLHRFRFPGPRTSAYKYLSVYECMTEVTGLEDKHVQ